jgi:polar amino acid transport system substrate-binding protein
MKRLVLAALSTTLLLAACGSDGDSSADTAAPADSTATTVAISSGPADISNEPAACANGKTLAEGTLTIATGDPAYFPYVIDDKPETGEGFEAAVALAVAEQLGFIGDTVTWVRTPFDTVIAPGPKDFDFNLQQFTITDERKEAVDFSDGYYAAPQAVFGLADSPAASAKTIADLRGLKIGVAIGTTSVDYVESVIAPDSDALIFNDNAAVKVALESKQIDAVVTDLPTAIYITGVEIEGTTVFGQIEGSGGDEWGLLLAKDSPLTECVNLALANLKDSGELEQITTTWMSEFTGAPIITKE